MPMHAKHKGGGKGKGYGRRQKDSGGHEKPGQSMSDPKPGTWPARTGYTSQSRLGAGKHGVSITVGSKDKM